MRRESFDIQMTRCYIRLLPDVPFVMFYEESGVHYWMAQFFDSTGSETTTIIDRHSFHPMETLPTTIRPLLTTSPSESVSCRSLFLLTSRAPSLPFHSLLHQSLQTSFVAVTTTYPCSMHADGREENVLQPPVSAACEILLRYSPQPYKSMLLEADRLHEELVRVRSNLDGEKWSPLDVDLLTTPLDYAEMVYQEVITCPTKEQALATAREKFYVIPTLDTPPLLMDMMNSPLTRLVQRGLEVIQGMMTCEDRNSEISNNNAKNNDSITSAITSTQRVQEWCREVDTWDDLLQNVLLHGYHSIGMRVIKELTLRNISENDIPLVKQEERVKEKEVVWVQSLEKCIQLFGSIRLVETSVCYGGWGMICRPC